MASSTNRKGKGTDKSTDWSDWMWDSTRESYYRWRYGPLGKPEYYYPPSTLQTDSNQLPDQNVAAPRTQINADDRTTPRYKGDQPLYTSGSQKPIEPVETFGSYKTVSANSGYSANYQGSQPSNYPDATTNYFPAGTPSSSYGLSFNTGSTTAVSSANSATYDSSIASSPSFYPEVATTPHATPASLTTGLQNLSLSQIPETGSFYPTNTPIPGVSHIRRAPNSRNYEELDPRYKEIDSSKQEWFWKVGRVFMMLWTEPAKHTFGVSRNGTHFSATYLNGQAFSEIRRFVVIKKQWGNSICSPIHTYGGQATLKPNLPDPDQHAIIYTSHKEPKELWYYAEDGTYVQEKLTKDPIRVKREQSGEEGDLGNSSRLNYSKIYTVEHYVRVLNIGMVHPHSMESLITNALVRQDNNPSRGPRDNPPRRDSSHSSKRDYKNEKHQSHRPKSKDEDYQRGGSSSTHDQDSPYPPEVEYYSSDSGEKERAYRESSSKPKDRGKKSSRDGKRRTH